MVIVLLLLVLWCQFSTAAADWYAAHLYPFISRVLSWLASPFGFSLTEIVVVLLLIAFIRHIVLIFKELAHWKKRTWQAVRLLIWVYVWFYAAWGINYSRSSLYDRMGTPPMPYEEAEFHAFLDILAEELNENWCPESELAAVDNKAFEQELKAFYEALPPEYGLCTPRKWQHPKGPVFNRLFSAVGVLGYIGPAFDEMNINREITPLERPFVHAHEYSHVLRVSSEAEANFWGFEATRGSASQAVRYSGWYMLLQYTWNNIQTMLGEEAFIAWTNTLRHEILDDMIETQLYWHERRITRIYNVQKRSYDKFLKSNHVSEGTGDYRQVLRLVLTFSDLHVHTDGEEG